MALATESVEAARRVGKPYYEVLAHRVLAFGALQRGDQAQAEEHALQALRLARDQDLTDDILFAVESVALVATRQGQTLKSARLLGAVKSRQEAVGLVEDPLWQAAVETMAAPAHELLGEERWAAAFAAGQALTLEEAVAEALEESSPG
jgi:hypothetical protein